MKHLNLKQLSHWKAEGKTFQLIDVREPEEHEAFNIGGLLIPLDDIFQHTAAFSRENPVIVYCKRGIRSQIAIQRLQSRCPEVDFYNLSGGIYDLLSIS